MKGKRLLIICIALCLLLSFPAHAAEPPAEGTPVIPEEESTSLETPPGTEEIPAGEESADESEAPPDTNESPGEELPPAADGLPDAETPPAEPEFPPAEAPDEAPAGEDEPFPEESGPVTLNVVLPTNAWVVVNPYGLEVNRGGISSTDQVVSAPMPIINYSSVPVAVLASVTGYTAPGSDVVFTAAPPQPDAWAKELFLYAEFQPAYDEYGGGAYWTGAYTGAYNQLTVTPEGTPAAQVLVLAAGDASPGCGAFRLFGSAAVSPGNPWCVEDAIQVTVAFTFLPLSDPQQI